MARIQFDLLDQWFDRLLDCDPAGRTQLLADLERDDPVLAESLTALLDIVETTENFLENEPGRIGGQLLNSAPNDQWQPSTAVDRSGEVLGAYRLESVIGRSNKAMVYLAHRMDGEWEEQVAVKVLSRGVDTDDVLRRFLAERQILTVLRHTHIAVLLDGGATSDALPYFVMEYIDGDPIDAWCNRHSLGLAERLRLFRDTVTAVAFAHRRLVVHRDIKPSNIMVNRHGQVKLLDFGIAKWLDPEAQTGVSARTDYGVRPMTPAYAAPEQLKGEGITTATDIYQLGLLMTTLLCGVEQPRRALAIDEAGIAHKRPSKVAAPEQLPYRPREISGDLDWIILKALSPEPEQRYGSASELLADLDNYLAHRTITARPPAAWYTVRKFVRRRPVLATVVGFAVSALVAGTLVVTHYNQQLEREKQAVLVALDQAREIRNLLVRLITEADPFQGSGADAKIRDALVNANSAIEIELANQPGLQAELYGIVGDAWRGLGEFGPARIALEKQYELLTTLEGIEPFQLLVAQRKLLLVQASDENIESQLAGLEALGDTVKRDYPGQSVERAVIEREKGRLLRRYGKAQQALSHFESAVAFLDTEPPADAHELAFALVELGDTLDDLQRHEESLALIQRALAIRVELLGKAHAWTLTNQLQLAGQFSQMGRLDEALAIFEELVPVYEERLGRLHVQTLAVMNNQAMAYMGAGRYGEAATIFTEVLERKQETTPEPNLALADSLQNLGALMVRLERNDEAIDYLQKADSIYQKILMPGNPLLGYPHLTLAAIHAGSGNLDALEEHARLAESFLRGNVPDNHPAWLKSQCLMGDALLRRGETAEGERLVKKGLAGLTQHPAGMSRHISECQEALVRAGIGSGLNTTDLNGVYRNPTAPRLQ